MSPDISRRDFVAAAIGGAVLAAGCSATAEASVVDARLTARPRKPKGTIAPGVSSLGLDSPRDALIYVPASFDAKKQVPLVVGLHGATQAGQLMIARLTPLADKTGAVLLAPDSRGGTWDAIRGTFGVDVSFIDKTLNWTFDRVDVDPARVILAGFSDGASYGLSLGIANGDLFKRLMAFSPGFVMPVEATREHPKIYVSHGVNDPILPIDQCSRRIVPVLKRSGYDVRFDEFAGGHQMPAPIIAAAAEWMS